MFVNITNEKKTNFNNKPQSCIINKNIKIIQKNVKKDKDIVDETIKSLNNFYESSESLKHEKIFEIINKMSHNLENNIDAILFVVKEFSKDKYENNIMQNNVKEGLEELSNEVNDLDISLGSLLKKSNELGFCNT